MVVLAVVVTALVAVNLWAHAATPRDRLLAGPVLALGLLVAGRLAGLSWAELGLSPAALDAGLAWAAGAAVLATAGYGTALAVPRTRRALRDERYRLPVPSAVRTAVVAVPLATVLLEEVAFRGVLWALLARERGAAVATVGTAVLFGLWHVLPALDMARANALLRGRGRFTSALTVAATVVATTAAGLVLAEIRRRSGSLVAPTGVHWAVNGLGVVAAALAWRQDPGPAAPAEDTRHGG